MAQVKFYSKSALPSVNLDTNGVYFIDNGELYKGSQRFGLGRVTVAASTEGITGMERGDIVVTGAGDGWVYAGTEAGWKSLGGNIESLRGAWRSDISTWTAGLVSTAQTNGTYIKQITQAEDGKVSAKVSNFATDVLTAVGNGDASSTANGITVSVTTTSGKVTDVQVSASQINCNSVTASSATFTDLTVTNTAEFTATEVSTGTLTVGGTAVDNVAASTASDNDAGVAVTVNTGNGGVKSVDVVVTSATLLNTLALTDFAGKSVVTTVGPATGSGAASDDNIATEKAVRAAIASLDNVMHFKGVVKSLPTPAEDGDIVVIGANPEGTDPQGKPLVAGQEYIYDGTKWEKIGDQSAVTGGGEEKNANGITIGVSTAAATASATVTLTVSAASTAADVSDANKASNVVTAGAVSGFVTGITDTKAKIGSSTTDPTHGVSATVSLASDAAPKIDITVDAITASTGVVANEGKVVTAGAVAGFVTDITNNKASVGTGSAAGGYGISGQVVLASDAHPDLTITVTPVSTSAGVTTGEDTVVTAGAVADYVTDAISTATAYNHGSETVTANADTLDKAMHAVAGAVDALNTKTDAYVGGTSTGSWTATGTSQAAISTTVKIDATTMAPSVTMAVNVAELQSALGLGAAAYRDVSTSVSDTTSTALVTEGAVATALAWITD